MREGVTGEVSECSFTTYDKLEPADARTNSSKIKGPARLLAHGKAFAPKDKCLGKVKVTHRELTVQGIWLPSEMHFWRLCHMQQ